MTLGCKASEEGMYQQSVLRIVSPAQLYIKMVLNDDT